ncbi:hypothetical protein AX16_001113 [Volvariella volvacea WC 439]|nr:hypothetical protein AX16_001113 [Volvariella volvacea WC 439]
MLHFITSVKLQELEDQRLDHQKHTASVLAELHAPTSSPPAPEGAPPLDAIRKVELLIENIDMIENIDKWKGSGSIESDHVVDGSFDVTSESGENAVSAWVDTLKNHIKQVGRRFDCAKLFGELFKEWLASGDSSTALPASLYRSVDDGSTTQARPSPSDAPTDGFVDVGRIERVEQKEKFNSIVFEEFSTDVDALKAYLGACYAGLALTPNKLKTPATLKEILNNETVQQEVASVLNMRISKLYKWTWPEEGVEIEFRRHLNGKYRAYTDPDIIDAILLQHLDSDAWLPAHPRLAPAEIRRLKDLGLGHGKNGIEAARQHMREKYFFLSQLFTSATRPQDALSSAAIKQKLLHILATERNLNKTLYRSHAIVRSDFEWFGPSLPHSSILTILEFLGMSKKWLSFYKRFLEAPLRFKGDPVGHVRTRKRGTPIAYALSVVCGEAVMFIMDFAVNRRAEGLFLYRMHDDLWLWDKDPRKCGLAWEEMKRYAELVGIKFNMNKTGSAVVVSPESGVNIEEVKELLPQGDVRWGFLIFDAEKGRFKIDQEDVDRHIKELRRQLDATKSVFGWVNLYNKYMAFFLRNFGGHPAKSYGYEHIEDCLQTLARIQRELFVGIPGGAVGYLRGVLEQKFGVFDLPEGYFHLPIIYGGLEVKNPLVEMLALPTDAQGMGAASYFYQKYKRDEFEYQEAKERFEGSDDQPEDLEFLPYEEYTQLRETHLDTWGGRYQRTLEELKHKRIETSPGVAHDMDANHMPWAERPLYLGWALALYGDELLKHFGSVKVVDEGLIPVGMVEVYRNSRIKLDE